MIQNEMLNAISTCSYFFETATYYSLSSSTTKVGFFSSYHFTSVGTYVHTIGELSESSSVIKLVVSLNCVMSLFGALFLFHANLFFRSFLPPLIWRIFTRGNILPRFSTCLFHFTEP